MPSFRRVALAMTRSPNEQSGDQYMTVQQLAHRLQVTPDFLYSDVLGQPGGIPAIRLGKGRRARWRIHPSDVVQWEERQRSSYDSAPPTAAKVKKVRSVTRQVDSKAVDAVN
ncbi:MAG: helix-turn-helix domain-containing protein [Nitrospirae bacterium]|nr:helix-turn-helix domain-containing protein [Nitrospirota bacterium]MDE3051994.1 helix-turn-helix domain-containing protein [Nitrospirota bacterium]MDE3218976.1 helix-turn-helix domain-containing protein [Nitrospirota bacterium]